MDKRTRERTTYYFSDSEKRAIIEDFINSNCTKEEIWRKYTGMDKEHGQLLTWMRKFGYDVSLHRLKSNIVSKRGTNMKIKAKVKKEIKEEPVSFEYLQMQKRITELEKQVKEAELKAIAFSTMVDIAEKEFKIPIRKKLNTKL